MMVWWMEIFTQKNVHPPQSFNTQYFDVPVEYFLEEEKSPDVSVAEVGR